MKTNDIAKVFRLVFPKMIFIAVFYIVISAAVLALINIAAFSWDETEFTFVSAFREMTIISTALFVSILGSIFFAIYFERFLSLGVTRKNIMLGFFSASCALSTGFAAVSSLVGLILGVYTVMEAGVAFFSFILICMNWQLAGFAAVVGCLFMRWYTGVIGIISCIIIANVSESVYTSKTFSDESLQIAVSYSPLSVIILLVIAIIVLLSLLKAVNRVSFKC